MFGVLAFLIFYSLITFGAVQSNSWNLLAIFWLVAIAGCFAIQTIRRRTLDISFITLFVLAALTFFFLPAKLAAGLISAAWAWTAARNNTTERTIRFMHILLTIGVLEALLGLVQFFLSPGWIFTYVNPFYRSTGTLINRNHYAGLLEMFIPVAFGLAYTAARKYGGLARPYVYLLAASFMALALLFSTSRMGIFSFLITLCFMGFLLQLRKSQRGLAAAFGLGVMGLVLAGALWIGVDVIVQRYSELVGQEAMLREGRILVYRDAIRMIQAHPFGVGAGNFQDQYRKYQTFRPELLFDHAHNDYLETAAEWGVAVASVFFSFLFFVVVRGVRLFGSIDSPENRGILLACSGAIFSILLHSLTDFNLQIPSNAMLFFTFVGVSLAMKQTSSNELMR
jgi:putative inorganic carbon (hco3(-)) transporter